MSHGVTEFSLIETFFRPLGQGGDGVVQGIGDDCAVLAVAPGFELAVSMDTLVSGVHFFPEVAADDLGYKALAVNLSDLAAMGATPKWLTLSVTLPTLDTTWLEGFCQGLRGLMQTCPITLVGGDTTQGPLSISMQVHGWLPQGQRLSRAGAKVGDRILVSGTLGDAGLALKHQLHTVPTQAALCATAIEAVCARLHRPTPRITLGQALLPHASSAIDVSDGLLADVGHIAKASGVSAQLEYACLPLSTPVQDYLDRADDPLLPLTAGDDYELCFTVAPQHLSVCLAEIQALGGGMVTDIGEIVPGDGTVTCDQQGQTLDVMQAGYRHFSGGNDANV